MSSVSGQTAIELQLVEIAEEYRGATDPNPPVAAAGLDLEGNLLSISAHEFAGKPHAEAKLIEDLKSKGSGGLSRLSTLMITLEPCNHQGRTGPCTDLILKYPNIQKVIFACRDLNGNVKGGGADRLRSAGIEVVEKFSHLVAQKRAENLLNPFFWHSKNKTPWVTIKTAHRENDSMIPPFGQKTFTSLESLKLAHQLRKRAGAIITGSGTVLADQPEFTVRHIPDFAQGQSPRRWLIILDRRRRLDASVQALYEKLGFQVRFGRGPASIHDEIDFLGHQGVLEVLVEAGPTLSQAIQDQKLWNEWVKIKKTDLGDVVEIFQRIEK